MKKSLLVISVILLIAGLFISCNSEAAGTGSDLAYVKFADDSKGLDSSITPWSGGSPDVNDLVWYYQAKHVSGVGSYGATDTWTRINDTTGLGGQFGPFSLGSWKFAIIGCSDTDTPTATYNESSKAWSGLSDNVMYYGLSGASATEVSSVAIKRGTNTINVTIHSTVLPPDSLTLTWDVDYNAPDATYDNGTVYYKVTVGATSYTGESTVSSLKANMSETGIAVAVDTEFEAVTVTFDVYADSNRSADYKLSTGSISFPALKGSTVAITGDIDDLGYEYAVIGDVNTDDSTPEAYLIQSSAVTGYDTLEEAIDAAEAGDTVVLADNVTYGTDHKVDIWEKEFNLDLGGRTFTTNSTFDIDKSNMGHKASAICYGESASTLPARSITVKNGTIITAYGAGIYADGMNLTLTIDGVTINAAQEGIQSTAEYSSAIRTTSKANVIVKSGSFNAGEGGYAVAVSNSCGSVTINGGTFNAPLFFSTGGSTSEKSITIEGGTFTATSVEAFVVNRTNGTLTIHGGTFYFNPTSLLSTGYSASETSTGSGIWTVSASN